MDFVTGAVCYAAHCNILARSAEAAAAVTFDVRKINQKIRIVNQPCHIDMTQLFVIDFLRVKVFSEIRAVVKNRAAEIAFGITALFGVCLLYTS